ncbi:NAD-dependent succinate-semialdehyde dehydrogenase [Methylocapsa palsarum]|uniref:Succinate-semialdehyde dehydrogenase / glutarate-semialdehyde dehydrogenase n=1 Tax=Methylocapsa palsarum TaxID=1612308 RepID=A0A1I4A964_9HYPH|nr:NAD-dependent succinate-semialdehyde dehydrogenase [Methylocapsa palsarum]SFK52356.1 succinate-semialdehyde dehydrogenase / glutarate-semialdehyde dehydrogenase [Methylocapsa palsarum]
MTAAGSRLFRSQAFIGGRWVDASDGRAFEVHDPADGALIAMVADCTPDDAEGAVAAAHRAFLSWRGVTPLERGRVLRRWFDLIALHAEDLAALLAREQGKPLAEARSEIAYGASFVEWFAEEARRIEGDIVASPSKGREILVLKEPVGVVAAITPWNFPNAMIARKVAPALAAGCAVLVKPAAETPLSALALGVLAQEAGLPQGVLNILPSTRAQEIGSAFTRHPLVRKISFTGSTAVGRLIMRDSAGTIKKLSLELGGNAPFIVFDDADLDAAVAGAIASKYRNSGQTCVCANRFYVQSVVYDDFAARLVKAAAALKVGGAFEPGVEQGPLISLKALSKVEALVADARARGARVLLGGARHSRGGTFYEPTVLGDVPSGAQLLSEEIFGPVAPLVRFETEEEAIALANASEFGLASYFYARDLGRVFRVARAIEAGMVAVNEGFLSMVEAPFGGIKQSGIGREGSRYGIEDYLELKYVRLGGLEG